MQPLDPAKIFAYAIAAITFSAGIGLMTGLLDYDVLPQVRYTFGAVLILMGLYRFVVTKFKPKPSKWRRITNVDDEE